MLDFSKFKESQMIYFKFGGGVYTGTILRINKKTITLNFPGDKENDKMDLNGVIKRCNDYYTLKMINEDQYKQRKYAFKIAKDWISFKINIMHLNLSDKRAEEVMKLAGYYDD